MLATSIALVDTALAAVDAEVLVAALVADTADAGVVLVVLVVLETAIFYEVRLDPTDYSKGASRQCMHNSCQKDWHELFMLFDLLTRYYRFVA
jgi:hypothetical protein